MMMRRKNNGDGGIQRKGREGICMVTHMTIINKIMKGGGKIMLKRGITFIIGVVALAAFLSFGCGGSNVPDFSNWTGPTVPIKISGSADMNSYVPDASGNLMCADASGTTEGTGLGDGPDSIADTASISCDFSIESGTETNLGYVQIAPDSISCVSLNNCIICEFLQTGNNCSVDCSGFIPSNALVATDSLTLVFDTFATFTTNMPAPDGVIRIDGLITDWSSIDPTSDLQAYDLSGCSGADATPADPMQLLDDNPNSDNSVSATEWHNTWSIDDVNNGNCALNTSLKRQYDFTGADVPATFDGDFTGGSIVVDATICDTETCSVPPRYFVKAYGGSGAEVEMWASIVQLTGGEYMVVTNTKSEGQGGSDAWILELTSSGAVNSETAYGAANNDEAVQITATSDGGYIVAGSYDGDGAGPKAWIKKVGTNAFENIYGAAGEIALRSIPTADGGYIFVGATNTYPADPGNGQDALVVKISVTGAVQWYQALGGASEEMLINVIEDSAGKFVVVGASKSFSTTNAGDNDCYVGKFDTDGTILWQSIYGMDNSGNDVCYSIIEADGGYIIAGETFVSGEGQNAMLLKLNMSDGALLLLKEYGGSDTSPDALFSVIEASGGDYIAAGYTVASPAVNSAALGLKVSATDLSIIWHRMYDMSQNDSFMSVVEASDGGFIFAGSTSSIGAGLTDILVVKADANGDIDACTADASSGIVAATLSLTQVSEPTITILTRDLDSIAVAGISLTSLGTSSTHTTECGY